MGRYRYEGLIKSVGILGLISFGALTQKMYEARTVSLTEYGKIEYKYILSCDI